MAQLTQTKSEAESSTTERRIFLLEDDPGNAAVIQTYIRMIEPATLVVATSIAELRARAAEIKAGAFDLVILDIALPDGESTAFAHDFREAGVENITAFTGRIEDRDLELFARSGFEHVFEKPILFSRFSVEYRALVGPRH